MSYQKLSANVYQIENALVEFPNSKDYDRAFSAGSWASAQDVNKNAIWYRQHGADNDLPQAREKLVKENNIVLALLQTKTDIWLGHGLMALNERFETDPLTGEQRKVSDEVEYPAWAKAFFAENDMDKIFTEGFAELAIHDCVLPELVRSFDGKIKTVEIKKNRHMRISEQDESGKSLYWFYCGQWVARKGGMVRKYPIIPIPIYTGEAKKQGKFIYPITTSILNDDYYAIPTWEGSRDWIELANAIPRFHIRNLENGYTMRWHIIIPQGYFSDDDSESVTAAVRSAAKTNEEARRQAFLDELQSVLRGTDNASSIIFSESLFSERLQKELPGIRIEPLNFDMKDQALLVLFEKTNQAVIAAQAIHPTLAAVETEQTRAGGSEILRSFQMYLLTKALRPRMAMLKLLELVQKVNAPEDTVTKWGFKDKFLTELSQNKNGVNDTGNAN